MSKKEKEPEIKDEVLDSDAEETTEQAEVTVEKSREEELEEQLASTKDSLLRTAAEYANYRARSAKEKEQSFTNAKCSVIGELLPVIDNLERAIASENGDYEALQKGVQMTFDGLVASLEKLGVESFGEAGDSFDPNLHNAVMHVEDEELGENVITDVFQKGYKCGDKIIRAAMVKTAN